MRKSIYLIGAVLWVGCGDSVTLEEAESLDTTIEDHLQSAPNIVMPWTRIIDSSVSDKMEVHDDRVIIDSSALNVSVEVGDIIVSVNEENPFLRKVTTIETVGAETVLETRNARLTEAVYKGTMTAEPVTFEDGRVRQGLNPSEYEPTGSAAIDNGVAQPEAGFSLTADPSLNLDVSTYRDLVIDRDDSNSEKHRVFRTNRACVTVADCGSETGTSQRRVACEQNQCVLYSDEKYDAWFYRGMSCDDIMGALSYANENRSCAVALDNYKEGRSFDREACGGRLPPHHVQVEWAKDNCEGALKRFVFDIEGSISPNTGEIKFDLRSGISKKVELWEGEKRLTPKIFFIGWLPVMITPKLSAKLEASVSASAGFGFRFAPISIQGLKYGGGVHYYQSQKYDDGKGVIVDGRFVPYSSEGGYGSFGTNPVRRPNPRLSPIDISGLSAQADLTTTIRLEFAPRFTALFYEAGGPFIEPLTPYGEAKSSISAFPPGDRCDDHLSNTCGKVGIAGKVGIESIEFFGKSLEFGVGLYDTCSDFCPANEEFACAKTCIERPTAPPIEIVLTWEDPKMDLDLEMEAPVATDYRYKDTPIEGYIHRGDTCPAGFAGCVDEPGPRGYQEIIETDVGFGPDPSTNHRITVKNRLSESVGPYSVVVKSNGSVIENWAGQSALQQGQSKEFEFVIR